MAPAPSEVEKNLCVGTAAVLHLGPTRKDAGRFRTVVRGWHAKRYVLLDRPKDLTGTYAALREGQACSVRYLFEGAACIFDTTILEWDLRGAIRSMRVGWPKGIRTAAFRKFERVPLRVPCIIRLPGGSAASGQLRDLSLGGCAMEVDEPCDAGNAVRIDFTLPDGARIADAAAVVRNCAAAPDGFLLGCEFEAEQGYIESDITFYIRSTLERHGGDAPPAAAALTLLLVDGNPESCARITRAARQKHVEVQLAGTALDGIFKLRAAAPAAAVVNASLPDLDGANLCRLIRRNPATGSIPLLLFGGEVDAAAALDDLQIEGCFPQGETMLPNLSHALAQLLDKLARPPAPPA